MDEQSLLELGEAPERRGRASRAPLRSNSESEGNASYCKGRAGGRRLGGGVGGVGGDEKRLEEEEEES